MRRGNIPRKFGILFSILVVIVASGCPASASAQGTANPVPLIDEPLVPTAAVPDGPGFTLTVNGTGFVSGAVIEWNGTALPTTFVKNSRLTAPVPASEIASPGTASVTVRNPAPGGGPSNTLYFQVIAPTVSVAFNRTNISIPSANNPANLNTMAVGDFNGDGKSDLVAITAVASSVIASVFLGNGDGTFGTRTDYTVVAVSGINSFFPSLTTGDFNNDGKIDLAVAYGGQVFILLGNGDGTFSSPLTTSTTVGSSAVAAGDFNGDGNLDLAVTPDADAGQTQIAILLGKGDGTFSAPLLVTPASGPANAVVGDFNGDGKLDLAVICGVSDNMISVLLGNGDGTFQSPVDSSVFNLGGAFSAVAADFNGDGRLDLAVTNPSSTGLAILIGNGDGTFQPAVYYTLRNFGSSLGFYGVVAGDFNGDGKVDLAVDVTTELAVLFGNGDGTFRSPIVFGLPAGTATTLAAADFNGDGRLDLALGYPGPVGNATSISIMLQTQTAIGLLSSNTISFGNQLVGTSSSIQTITLTSAGSLPLSIASIAISTVSPASYTETNTCPLAPSTLAPGAQCSISVTFSPVIVGNIGGMLVITDNDPNSPENVSLPSLGVGVSLSATSLTFANQKVGTTSPAQTVTVNNVGPNSLAVTSVSATGYFSQTNTCAGNNIPGGSSCTVNVTFTPGVSGTTTGTVSITDSDPSSPQTVALTGTTGPDFTLTASTTTATISPGQTATYTLNIAPLGGFNQAVSLTCSGAPSGSTCTVSPNSVVLNGSTAGSVTVTVTTTAGASLGGPQNPTGSPIAIIDHVPLTLISGLFALALLVYLFYGRSDQRPQLVYGLGVAILFCVASMMLGCGGGSSGGGNQATPAGSYSLTLSATSNAGSTALTHSVNLSLIVQ